MRASAEEVRRMLENGGDRTDWERVRAMPQEEVERLAEEEDGPFEDWRLLSATSDAGGVVAVDPDILAWFRATGPGWEARLNGVLRAHVEGQRPG